MLKFALILALLTMTGPVAAKGPPDPDRYGPCPDSSEVVVRAIDQPLPLDGEAGESDEGSAMDPVSRFLWDNFANKPDEMRFRACTTRHLKANCRRYGRGLVAKAAALNLDAASLDSCLVRVGESGLPVGAYVTTRGSRPVWIIVVKWEWGSDERPRNLEHIRVHAFDARDYSQVGFITCS